MSLPARTLELAESAFWVGFGLVLIGATFGNALKRDWPRKFGKAIP